MGSGASPVYSCHACKKAWPQPFLQAFRDSAENVGHDPNWWWHELRTALIHEEFSTDDAEKAATVVLDLAFPRPSRSSATAATSQTGPEHQIVVWVDAERDDVGIRYSPGVPILEGRAQPVMEAANRLLAEFKKFRAAVSQTGEPS